MKTVILGLLLFAQNPMPSDIDRRTTLIESQVIRWRRDFHEHPELGNRETRTARVVADHLRSLGIEVKTGVALPLGVRALANLAVDYLSQK